jgi:hypothetical protein
MAGFLAASRGAADAAEAMPRMPEGHRPRQCQQRPFVPRQAGAELAQIAEPQPGRRDPGCRDPGCRDLWRRDPGGGDCRRAQHIERCVMRRQVEREMSAVIDQAEKYDPSLRQPFIDLAVAGAKQRRNRFDA